MPDPVYHFIPDLLAQVVDIPADSILSRTFFSSPEFKVILFAFAPGQELSEHTAAKPALLHFLKGEAHLKLGADEMEVSAGAWVHMPPHLPHSIFARSGMVMLLYMFESHAAA